jgi:hypothetical protein
VSVEIRRVGGLVARHVGVAHERVEGAVARRVGHRGGGGAQPRRPALRVGADDRLRDALRGDRERARVERVAAQRGVAGVVGRPDRPGRRVRVGGRQQDAVRGDLRAGDAPGDLLGQRVRDAAEVGLHERELAPVLLEHERPGLHARVDALAGHERLGVEVLVGIGDDLQRPVDVAAGDGRPRRVGEHRRADRRRDVGARGAGAQLGGVRGGGHGDRQRADERSEDEGGPRHARVNVRVRPFWR